MEYPQETHSELVQFCREEVAYLAMQMNTVGRFRPVLYIFEEYDKHVRVPDEAMTLSDPPKMESVHSLVKNHREKVVGYMLVFIGEHKADHGEIAFGENSIFVPRMTKNAALQCAGGPPTEYTFVGMIEFDDEPYTLLSTICEDGSGSDVTVSRCTRAGNFANVLIKESGYLN